MQTQIRWAGHLVRMPDYRLPKILLYGELEKGKRSQGGQKKRYKDSLKTSLKAFEIDQDTWEEFAQNRSTWRLQLKRAHHLVKRGEMLKPNSGKWLESHGQTKIRLRSRHSMSELSKNIYSSNRAH